MDFKKIFSGVAFAAAVVFGANGAFALSVIADSHIDSQVEQVGNGTIVQGQVISCSPAGPYTKECIIKGMVIKSGTDSSGAKHMASNNVVELHYKFANFKALAELTPTVGTNGFFFIRDPSSKTGLTSLLPMSTITIENNMAVGLPKNLGTMFKNLEVIRPGSEHMKGLSTQQSDQLGKALQSITAYTSPATTTKNLGTTEEGTVTTAPTVEGVPASDMKTVIKTYIDYYHGTASAPK